MEWIRKVSLVRRVVIGFSVMGAWCAGLGVAAVSAMPGGAAATAIGVAAGAGCATWRCWPPG